LLLAYAPPSSWTGSSPINCLMELSASGSGTWCSRRPTTDGRRRL